MGPVTLCVCGQPAMPGRVRCEACQMEFEIEMAYAERYADEYDDFGPTREPIRQQQVGHVGKSRRQNGAGR